MSKILSIITSTLIVAICFLFVACDYTKKYTEKDIETYYNQMQANESLSPYFNQNGEFEIKWSTQLQTEFAQTNSLLKPLDNNYAFLIETATNVFTNFNSNIAKSWSKSQTTKIYNALSEFCKVLNKFNTQKSALEDSMSNYVAGEELDFVQTYNYDVLVDTSKKLLNKAIKLGDYTINGVINNNYEKFWTEHNLITPAWHYIKTVNLYNIIEITKVAYEFDIKTSYIVLDRKFMFETNITNRLNSLVNLYKQKSAIITANSSYTFTDAYKNELKDLVLNNEQFENTAKIYFKALDKINVAKLHNNKHNIALYMDNLSISEKTNFNIVNDYNAFTITYVFGLLEQQLQLL